MQEMEQQGVIEPLTSAWSSPVVLVTKKDGSMRFCVDVTEKDSYPLPCINDTTDALAWSQVVLHTRTEEWLLAGSTG